MDHKNGQMEPLIKVNLKMIKQTVRENLCIRMEIIIKEIGLKIRLKELVDIREKVEDIIKVDGKKINLKDMEFSNGEMEIFIKVNLEMD